MSTWTDEVRAQDLVSRRSVSPTRHGAPHSLPQARRNTEPRPRRQIGPVPPVPFRRPSGPTHATRALAAAFQAAVRGSPAPSLDGGTSLGIAGSGQAAPPRPRTRPDAKGQVPAKARPYRAAQVQTVRYHAQLRHRLRAARGDTPPVPRPQDADRLDSALFTARWIRSGPRSAAVAPDPGPDADLVDHRVVRQLTEHLGLTRWTRVQDAAITLATGLDPDRYDMLIRAPTGSGKTLAFLVPIVQGLLASGVGTRACGREAGTFVLVVAPTHELATQLFGVAQQLVAPFPHLVAGLLLGGENRQAEKRRLARGITLVVSTPGRLIDHLMSTRGVQAWPLPGCRPG